MPYQDGHNLGLYILNEDCEPVPESNTRAWARWLETANRHLADDKVGPYRVSTVFMGLNQGFGRGDPVLWETIVFGLPEEKGIREALLQTRYSSKADALAGHARAVEYARSLRDG